MASFTSIDFFLDLTIDEFFEAVDEIVEASKK